MTFETSQLFYKLKEKKNLQFQHLEQIRGSNECEFLELRKHEDNAYYGKHLEERFSWICSRTDCLFHRLSALRDYFGCSKHLFVYICKLHHAIDI